ncbi:ribosomal protein S5 domain 2-like protein [Fistulina hepatica ATCC 64428]|nr:ribosomal protein S5 domain 2-like protein [Fistulina hepatica ATCC 64428]
MAQSTFDRRRINGPDESFAPVFEVDPEPERKAGDPRIGRGARDIRPLFLRPGLITQANGSAFIETERTKIACAVYGPRQSKTTAYSEKGRLNVEVKFTPFASIKRKSPLRDVEDRSIAIAIHQALAASVRLELVPKSTIDVFIVIIESDGTEGCIASGTVAASTALADAGIEMIGLVSSCAASVVDSGLWLDPTAREASVSNGTVILSCLPALGTITNVWQSGSLTPVQAIQAIEACQEKCAYLHSIMAQVLLESSKSS